MPKTPEHDREDAERLRLLDELESPDGWHCSAKGNLTREWAGDRLVVYRRRGRYWWVISPISPEEAEPRFGRRGYATEHEAMAGLVEAVLSDWY